MAEGKRDPTCHQADRVPVPGPRLATPRRVGRRLLRLPCRAKEDGQQLSGGSDDTTRRADSATPRDTRLSLTAHEIHSRPWWA
jgi:hypothetical protein